MLGRVVSCWVSCPLALVSLVSLVSCFSFLVHVSVQVVHLVSVLFVVCVSLCRACAYTLRARVRARAHARGRGACACACACACVRAL